MGMTKASLVGRWVHLSEGDHYRNGQITLSLGTSHHLIKWLPFNDGPNLSNLLRSDDLCTDEKEDRWVCFFDSENELNAWMAWINTPSTDKKPRIVELKPKAPKT
jgi:hypothetical protein